MAGQSMLVMVILHTFLWISFDMGLVSFWHNPFVFGVILRRPTSRKNGIRMFSLISFGVAFLYLAQGWGRVSFGTC